MSESVARDEAHEGGRDTSQKTCGPQQRAGVLCNAEKAPLTAPVWIVACKEAHGGKDPSEEEDAGFGGGMVPT